MPAISVICFQLEEKNIQYNLMISDSGKKSFLFLQVPAVYEEMILSSCTLDRKVRAMLRSALRYMKQKTCVASHAISAWEYGGYLLFRNRYQFDQVTEDAMVNRLNSFSLDDNNFEAVKQLCCSIASKFDV
ncbi:hypothetical protein GOBAR_DD06563 [Gossypium barbadense]|nr:hypothetical protein GOBAR_DD06563 [Gossypium barbadense]